MKKFIVYGPGCAKCKQAEEIVRTAVAESGIAADVEKVSDIQAMVAAGIMSTPAVSVDGVVKMSGRVPKPEDVKGWLGE